jgi:putative serine protease PepD
MTDPHEPGRAPGRLEDPSGGPRTAGGAPPPSPWWSRPESPWDPPRGHDDRAAASPQPPYGSWVDQEQPSAPAEDPWRSPSSTAVFRTGAQAWGYPADTTGRGDERPSRARRGLLGTLALVVVTALVAGGVGGFLGARSAERDGLLDPSATLGGSGSSAPANVDRAPESVAGIAATVMRSTVSIAVQGGTARGTGSGVVIRSDGYILTNNHVVAAAEGGGQILVTFDDGATRLPARIVGLDPVTDLAVLRVDSDRDLQAATLGRSRDLVVGDPAIAIGSPLGLSGTVTTGIISALNRTVDVPSPDGGRNPLFNAIQTDAAINPGNSGGALVNARGEVIGINTAIATLGGGLFGSEGGGSIGVGFAIPIDEAASVAEEIIRTGRATHPAIGVSALTVTGENQEREGARIQQLSPGGAAELAGLQPGDLIIRVDDQDVTSVDELILAIRRNSVGESVTVTYVRQGQTRTAEVTLQDLPRS